MEPALEVVHLSRRYGELLAVDDVSFTVAPGEVVGLLGRNGAGKTTTVEILEGFRAPTSGTARVLGRDPLGSDRDVRNHTGVVLQVGALEPSLRVREVLGLYAGFYRPRRPVAELLSDVGLLEQARSRVGALSGGQRRRLDLALAIAGNPRVLMLDEPTTGLDPEARRLIWQLIVRLRIGGAAILLTSHYLEEVQTLADRVIVLHRGRVIASGTPDELRGAAPPDTTISFRVPPALSLPSGPWVEEEALAGRTVLSTAVPMAALERLVSWAVREGIELDDLEVRRPSLEDAYFALTTQP